MVYPVAWAAIILVRLLFAKQSTTQREAQRSGRVLLLKFLALSFGISFLIRMGPWAVPFGLVLALYMLPGLVLNCVLVPLGWPRVAYYYARIAWPLGFSDSDAVVASYYAVRALHSKSDAQVFAKVQKAFSKAKPKDMNGGAVVTLGLVALANGEPEQARQLFHVAHALNPRFISRGTRALARDYLVVDAVRSGAYRTAIRLGTTRKPTLRWAYFVARASQRLIDDPAAPSNFKLWIYYLVAPRRRVTYSLLRRALDRSALAPSIEQAAPDLASALATLAATLRDSPTTNTARLNAVVSRVEAALTDPKTHALIERRLLGLNSNESVEAVLSRFRAELVDRLVPLIERSDELDGSAELTPVLEEAFHEARRGAFRELSALCKDYRKRTEEETGLDTDVEWKLWANFRATAERVLRIDPQAGQEVFAEAFIPICNFAVLQHNTYKALALAHSMYAWLHRHADWSPKDSLLLAKNMKAAAS
ncbi:MAG TPA: hypothetical protein VFQ35_08625 [Polyangiaceae bacterium]|nr:hypothetical protein [Polyangiaceae bacterium]